jgi:serine/threonine protein kinase
MLHADNITHYDLKCDNILLDYKTNSESEIRVTLGDFGTCKMFTDEEDEFCMKPIGTEAIRPPEMLNLNRNMNNLDDNYDRRRKVSI